MVEITCYKCGASWEFDGDSECPGCHTDNQTTYNPEVEGNLGRPDEHISFKE